MTVGNEPGVYHVVPAGEFTPSSKAPEVFLRDLSVWRNIMREAAEEFLNVEEAYGEGDRGIDFTADHPYVELQEAVKSGHLVTWCFGLVIDAACLKSELLTIMVMDAREFDRTFAKMVAENREGNIIAGPSGKGVAFTKSNIDSYLSDGSVTSAAKACLALAWANQDHLKLGI